MDNLENETVAQIALVVDDIEKYLDGWVEVFGIERPAVRITDAKDLTHIRYMGKETDARAKLAFIKTANISIELIEPIGAPSVWRATLKEYGPSVHHIAFRTKDKTQVLDKLGLPVTQTGVFKGGNYTYLDGREKLAVDLEILESTP